MHRWVNGCDSRCGGIGLPGLAIRMACRPLSGRVLRWPSSPEEALPSGRGVCTGSLRGAVHAAGASGGKELVPGKDRGSTGLSGAPGEERKVQGACAWRHGHIAAAPVERAAAEGVLDTENTSAGRRRVLPVREPGGIRFGRTERGPARTGSSRTET